jgi:hypothetical protein
MEENTGFMDKLAELVANFDIANILPELDSFLGWMELLIRLAVMAGPLLVLIFGCIYFFMPPKEANHSLGYRFYWGMGSEYAWRFTQRLAGFVWMIAGGLLTLIMFFVTVAVGGKDLAQMGYDAVVCLFWELGVIVVACLAIDVVVLLRYDRKGRVRPNTVIRVGERFLGMEMPREEYPQEEYPQEDLPYEEGQPQM